MPKCADTDKQKISQYQWLPISEPIIGATLVRLHVICKSLHSTHIQVINFKLSVQ